jgi:hypothetical protein
MNPIAHASRDVRKTEEFMMAPSLVIVH